VRKQEHVGKKIKAHRMANHYTQERMAEFLGVSRATIVRLERGGPCYDITRAKIENILAGKKSEAA
jgi:DNA-binding XRE family transcriptional regulator